MNSLQLTQGGIAAANANALTLLTFQLGDAFAYTPTSLETTLKGNVIYTGGIAAWSVDAQNILTVELNVDLDCTQNFGEIGIFTSSGILFAIGVFPSLIRTPRITDDAASVYTIRCLLTVFQLNNAISVDTTYEDYGAASATQAGLITLRSPQFLGKGIKSTGTWASNFNTAASTVFDLNTGDYFIRTVSVDTTFSVLGVLPKGIAHEFYVDLNVSKSVNVTWWSSISWAMGTSLLFYGRNLIKFITCDGGLTWIGILLAPNLLLEHEKSYYNVNEYNTYASFN